MDKYLFGIHKLFKKKYIKKFIKEFNLEPEFYLTNSYINDDMVVNIEKKYINIMVFNNKELIHQKINKFFAK